MKYKEWMLCDEYFINLKIVCYLIIKMLIAMLVLRLACNGFEMDDISSEATTFKIWELTS